MTKLQVNSLLKRTNCWMLCKSISVHCFRHVSGPTSGVDGCEGGGGRCLASHDGSAWSMGGCTVASPRQHGGSTGQEIVWGCARCPSQEGLVAQVGLGTSLK